jgi:hypothetical protein
VTTTQLPLDEWRLMLTALCADSPAWIGTLGAPETYTLIYPTRFSWLRSLRWWPPDDAWSGLARLDLAEPGTVAAVAWEPLCEELRRAPPALEGRILFGRFVAPGARHTAVLNLVTDFEPEGTAALVRSVRIRIEPVRDWPA